MPDSFTVGASMYESETQGYNAQNAYAGRATSDAFNYGATLGWNIGTAQRRHDDDFERLEDIMLKTVDRIAAVTEKSQPVVQPPIIIPQPGPWIPPDDKEDDSKSEVMGFFEWYGQATLLVQIIIASLIIGILITIVLMRKSIIHVFQFVIQKAKKSD